jgi:hypothetical protein
MNGKNVPAQGRTAPSPRPSTSKRMQLNKNIKESHMQIKFTKEQYKQLVEMVALANSVINSDLVDPSEERDSYINLEQYIYSQVEAFNAPEYIEHDAESGTWLPTENLEEKVVPFIDEYLDAYFWDELATQLAWRDLLEEKDEKELEKLSEDVREDLLEEHLDKWDEEFEKNGVDHLRIQK